MSTDSSNENINPMEKLLHEIEAKSKKKKIIGVSTIVVLIPVILAVIYTISPQSIIDNTIDVNDFPVELIGKYDTLCIHDQISISCLIKNDGRIEYKLKDGVHIFQTKDYSLLKNFDTRSGYEEKSISDAWYDQTTMLKITDYNGIDYWLITGKGR